MYRHNAAPGCKALIDTHDEAFDNDAMVAGTLKYNNNGSTPTCTGCMTRFKTNRIMRLRELLARCDFDSIVPHILRIYPRHATQLPWYKEAYDILCHTECRDYDCTIRVAWCNDDVEYGGKPYIHVYNCEGQCWEGCLGAQLDVADDVYIADAELAARCLWSLTFYGFRPDEYDYFSKAPRNPYEEQAERLKDAQFRNYARRRPERFRALSKEEWKIYHRRQNRRNRPKRMRDHRQEMRIKQLKHMGCVENTIRQILARTTEISREQLVYLSDTQLVHEPDYHSRAYDLSQRMDYLHEILARYATVDKDRDRYTRVVALLSVAPEHPLQPDEREAFRRLITLLPPHAQVLSATGTRPGLGVEAELLLVKSF